MGARYPISHPKRPFREISLGMASGIDAEARWSDRLREAGLRVTRPRVTVLDLLAELGGHHTAEGLNATLTAAGDSMTRGTVYNVIDDLVRAGLVMQADRGPGTAVYELAGTWHHHFICRECGVMIDVECEIGEKPCVHGDVPGAVVDEAQIILRGVCTSCAAAQ